MSTKISQIRQTVDGMDMKKPHDTDIGAKSNQVSPSLPPIGNGKKIQARKQEVDEGKIYTIYTIYKIHYNTKT